MANFLGTLFFSFIMGFSIYLSLPIIMRRKTSAGMTRLLNAVAIGILIFLTSDVFSNVAPTIYNGSLYGYGASPLYSSVFMLALAFGFFMLYRFENKDRAKKMTPEKASMMIASGIGFQNLTEGLLFGALSVNKGLFSGVALVVLLGFMLQDITEGFPISSPFIGKDQDVRKLVPLFLIGALPAVIGASIGFYYASNIFDIIIDGLAMGCMFYVILPMIKALFRDMDPIAQRISYMGIFLGFVLGFIVNLI